MTHVVALQHRAILRFEGQCTYTKPLINGGNADNVVHLLTPRAAETFAQAAMYVRNHHDDQPVCWRHCSNLAWDLASYSAPGVILKIKE